MHGSVPWALVPLDTMETMGGLVSHDFFNCPYVEEKIALILVTFLLLC